GERLRRIYGEGDLIVAQTIGEGLLEGVSPAEAAWLASAVLYESRERIPRRAELPTPALRTRMHEMDSLWRRIREVEESHQVELSRELDPGLRAPLLACV